MRYQLRVCMFLKHGRYVPSDTSYDTPGERYCTFYFLKLRAGFSDQYAFSPSGNTINKYDVDFFDIEQVLHDDRFDKGNEQIGEDCFGVRVARVRGIWTFFFVFLGGAPFHASTW